MGNSLEKKYGLWFAIAMVVGIVVGSGVFFKAEKILVATGGNLTIGILAWLIGGVIMIICAYTFATMATKYEYVGGVVDYADATVGKTYGYYIGWFFAIVYYPCLTSVLAWVSARYICVLLGLSITGGEAMVLSALLLVASYALNVLSPILAGKFQVTTTVIKLIPLLLMAVVGTIFGLGNGMLVENFTNVAVNMPTGTALFTAVVATSFAYEGWIIATSINGELKDAKKNLPRALLVGTLIVMLVYLFYYVGLAGGVSNSELMLNGEQGARIAFARIFTSVGGTLLFVFVVISCLGTLNGLMLACTRGLYALAVRDMGPKPQIFKQLDPITNMPANSSVVGVLMCAFWLFYFYCANLTKSPFGFFTFDSSELPIVAVYAAYIPMFIMFICKERDLSPWKRIVMPCLALLGSSFMVVAAFFAHGISVVAFLIVTAFVLMLGAYFQSKNKKEACGKQLS